ncbi:phospholipid-transporting ATPase ABCA3 isoform X2 [Drosophila biarmipes]|uniref:phospholipid-transporting ATPase ABCA3 isoform X2 n=1 Tax=Drosophila biarmipes TaxID=125945 RepID=UPI001CDB1EE5|nr:phospholipid-transporting ATPase ABCA3 isoform X2 [Drosophila biarmipes]
MAAPNCFVKFLLLVWKNFSMLPGRKCYMISLFIFFVLLPIFCMCLRLVPDLRKQSAIPGPTATAALLYHFPENIFYSPKTEIVSKLVNELKINKTTGFKTPEKLHEALVGFPLDNSSVIGIQFYGSWTEWPDKLSVAIRAPIRSALDVNDMFSMEGNPLYISGFLSIQQALSQMHIMYKCKQMKKCQRNMTFPEFKDLPTPPIYGSDYTFALQGVAKLLIQVIIFFVVISLTKSIVEEKELQLKETLNLLGVGSGLQWLAWYTQNFIVLLFGSAMITLCWKVVLPKAETSFLPFTHWSIVLFILLILSHCMICFSFLMSSLKSSTRHISLITILALFATNIPIWVLYSNNCAEGVSAFCALFILSGLGLLQISLSSWEAYGVGLQWHNLFKHSWPGDTICVGYILLLMLLASLLSVLICLYVERIRPGPYGVSRPWHFLCTCCCPTENLVPYKRFFYRIFGLHATAPDVERPDHQLLEADPEGKKAGVQIRGLSKVFGKREAVKPLSFDIFEDQITVLMGHNGAGKTTLISMLAGFISPTSGTALINGYDIRRERNKARSCIGLCPQHNSLFKHLSPTNHIWFFSRLRGVKGADVKAEVEKYLEKLNLQHRRKTAARNLSGGTQRRLSVACSLCGGVKVLICDEPSTGLDPGARRELWKLILEAKEGCTILLTTHHLDEGEVLGDRIVIISDGRLRCIGSLQFLKKQVDAACLLTCETRKRCDVDKLSALIARHVGEIRPFSIKGRDVCYKLPLSKSKTFSALFKDLEHQMKELGVRGFGMSSVSLDEIFMSFGAEDFDARKAGGAEKKDDEDDDDIDNEDEDEDQEENERNCGKHWLAMMIKKTLSLYDNKVMRDLLPAAFVASHYLLLVDAFEG